MATSYDEMARLRDRVFAECERLMTAGQAEYAHRADDALSNFRRVAERLGADPAAVCLTYLEKHLDGIHAHVQGHRSQRENVAGRINDAINYLVILRAIFEEAGETGQQLQPDVPIKPTNGPA